MDDDQAVLDTISSLPDVTQDEVFKLLGCRRRRLVLRYLLTDDEGSSVRDIARYVAAWENDAEPDTVSSSDVHRVYVSLYQYHLPKIGACGLIQCDSDDDRIRPTIHLSGLSRLLTEDGSSTGRTTNDRLVTAFAGFLSVTTLCFALMSQCTLFSTLEPLFEMSALLLLFAAY